ncbi:MAG: glycosyl hydrolase family 95 catalytic domain-containing protein, partial [Promethearchaeota archaeon]
DAIFHGHFQYVVLNITFRCIVHSTYILLIIEFGGVDAGDLDRAGNVEFDVKVSYDHLDDRARNTLKAWGFPPLKHKKIAVDWKNDIFTVYQEIPGKQGGLIIAWTITQVSNKKRLSCAMFTHNNLSSAIPSNRSLMQSLIKHATEAIKSYRLQSWRSILEEHFNFWHEYWNKSKVSIPDNVLENLYYIELYKLACNSRHSKFPCPLQGIWTIDGIIPPWNGDYHLDMNVQEAYWPIYANNRLELGEPLFRWLTGLIPVFRKRCKEFYGCDGIWTSCSISLEGANLHGYYNTEAWPGNGAWAAHMFWLYWLYTKDKKFLKEQALPFMKGVAELYLDLLELNEFDEYHIPLGSSPEYHEHLLDAWGKNPTCDIALVRWLFSSLLEAKKVLGLDDQPDFWEMIKDRLENLVFFPADMDGLQVMEDVPYSYSHRHMTHLFPIHPFHIINVEGDRDDRFLVKTSLRRLRKIGNWEWTGWTLPWLSMISCWANNPWLTLKYARDYLLFINENSMHVNGDPKDLGICCHVYEPMTLEAGFCFATAIPEMLLKSWGGIIRVFECIPRSWHDACFADLRAEGAFLVSASLSGGKLSWIKIKSEAGSELLFKNHYGITLNVFDYNTGKLIDTIDANQVFFNIKTKVNDELAIIPADQQFNKEGIQFRHIKPIFNGKHWFGLQEKNPNPYLP